MDKLSTISPVRQIDCFDQRAAAGRGDQVIPNAFGKQLAFGGAELFAFSRKRHKRAFNAV